MAIRRPSNEELRQFYDQLPRAQRERDAEQIAQCYAAVREIICSGGSSRSKPLEQGYRTRRYSRQFGSTEVYRDAEFAVGYFVYQEHIRPADEAFNTQDHGWVNRIDSVKWSEIPVYIMMRLVHQETGLEEEINIARVSRGKVEWPVQSGDGDIEWCELDLQSEDDNEKFWIVKETIEWMKGKNAEIIASFV